jgi:WD40 repeat protein
VEIYGASTRGPRGWQVRGRLGDLAATLPAHDSAIKAIAIGRAHLATATDEVTKLWTLRDRDPGKLDRTIQEGGGSATPFTLAFSPDGEMLAGGSGNEVRIWRVVPRWKPRPIVPQAILPQYGYYTSRIAVLSSDGTRGAFRAGRSITVLDTAEDELLVKLDVSGADCALSPDGKRIATTEGVWDATNGKKLFDLPITTNELQTDRVVFSPDGKRIATAGAQTAPTGTRHVVQLWDLSTSQELVEGGQQTTPLARKRKVRRPRREAPSQDQDSPPVVLRPLLTFETGQREVADVQFSPDGATIAANDGETLKLWSASDGKELLWPGREGDDTRRSIREFAFSPDGERILLARRDSLTLCDVATGDEILAISGAQDPQVVAFSPDGERIVSSETGADLTLWHAQSGQKLLRLSEAPGETEADRASGLQFHPDGLRIAVSGKIWEAADWQTQEAGSEAAGPNVPGEN